VRPFTSTIAIDEARRRLAAGVRPIVRTEHVTLDRAGGRIAAADVTASIHVPPFSRSAMDGYAVRAEDTANAATDRPVTLSIVECIYTGQVPQHTIKPGTSAEIATGAPLPSGADAVVMVEQTSPAPPGHVNILARAVAGQNVGLRGADISPGDVVTHEADVLTPSRIGALAAIGCASVSVYARPRVAIVSTGNEVVEPGAPLTGSTMSTDMRWRL
jgi:molybdopterin biosynthesis enzyme